MTMPMPMPAPQQVPPTLQFRLDIGQMNGKPACILHFVAGVVTNSYTLESDDVEKIAEAMAMGARQSRTQIVLPQGMMGLTHET